MPTISSSKVWKLENKDFDIGLTWYSLDWLVKYTDHNYYKAIIWLQSGIVQELQVAQGFSRYYQIL